MLVDWTSLTSLMITSFLVISSGSLSTQSAHSFHNFQNVGPYGSMFPGFVLYFFISNSCQDFLARLGWTNQERNRGVENLDLKKDSIMFGGSSTKKALTIRPTIYR